MAANAVGVFSAVGCLDSWRCMRKPSVCAFFPVPFPLPNLNGCMLMLTHLTHQPWYHTHSVQKSSVHACNLGFLDFHPNPFPTGVDCYRREAQFCSGDNRDATYSRCRHFGGLESVMCSSGGKSFFKHTLRPPQELNGCVGDLKELTPFRPILIVLLTCGSAYGKDR